MVNEVTLGIIVLIQTQVQLDVCAATLTYLKYASGPSL